MNTLEIDDNILELNLFNYYQKRLINGKKSYLYRINHKQNNKEKYVLSIGKIKFLRLYVNRNEIFVGVTSIHCYGTKLIIELYKGVNEIEIVLNEQQDINVKLEKYSKLCRGFWQDEYKNLHRRLVIYSSYNNKKSEVKIIVTNSLISLNESNMLVKLYDATLKLIQQEKVCGSTFSIKLSPELQREDIVVVEIEMLNERVYYGKDIIILKNEQELLGKFSDKSFLNKEFMNTKFCELNYEQRLYLLYCYKREIGQREERVIVHHYKSSLDCKLNNFIMVLPKEYTNQKKYPLLIVLATDYSKYEKGLFIKKALTNEQEVCIALINIRGITMGAWIGEATFWENFRIIQKEYSIENEKVYLTGYSNGAFAAWSLLEKFPWFFTAAVILSGEANYSKLINVSSNPILCIGAENDYELFSGYNSIKCVLEQQENKEFILLAKEEHSGYYFYYLSCTIINWLMRQKRNTTSCSYITNNVSKYNDVFTIYEVYDRRKYAGVFLEDYKVDTKRLSTYNVKSLGVNVLKLATRKIEICMDGVKKQININNDEEIEIRVEGKKIIEKKEKMHIRHPFGINIQDIYLDNVTIINDLHFEETKYVINNFARPYSAGWNMKIEVDYPVLTINNANLDNYTKRNVIYITDNILDSNMVHHLKKSNITANENDFKYKNLTISGKYLFLFITPISQEVNSKNILFVYASDRELFHKSFLTRRLVLSSNISDEYKVLDNSLVVFDGKEYFGFKI